MTCHCDVRPNSNSKYLHVIDGLCDLTLIFTKYVHVIDDMSLWCDRGNRWHVTVMLGVSDLTLTQNIYM